MTSERACIRALREAADRLGESPTKTQYESLGLTPSSATVLRVMGGWNDAKEAAGLQTNYSRGSRVAQKPDDVDLPDELDWEDLSQDQRWHYKNRERNNRRTLDRRDRRRAWVYTLKRASDGCNRCEESDPACLEYHHIDEEEKEMAVGRMITRGYPKAKTQREIEKCELRCANCHRKEHYEAPAAVDDADWPD